MRDGREPIDRETRDALRLETQSTSPRERAEFERTVTEAHHVFIGKWARFIDSPVAEDEISSRVYDVDESIMNSIQEHLIGRDALSVHGLAVKPLGLVFVNNGIAEVEMVWASLPDGLRDQIRTNFDAMDDEAVLERLRSGAEWNTITHEIAHLYQGDGPPGWFFEIGAYWHGRTAQQQKFDFALERNIHIERADAYEALIDKYGDKVHEVFFGKLSESELLAVLSKYGKDKIDSLFPPTGKNDS